MYHWSNKLIRIIENFGLKAWMKSAYCEDVCSYQPVHQPASLKWDPETKVLVSCEPVLDGSDIDALSVFCAEELRKCMDSISPDLLFEMESKWSQNNIFI